VSTREVRVDLLVGRRVRDVHGRPAGRIQEVRADRVAEECYVRDFLLGSQALVRRLLGGVARLGPVRTLGIGATAPLAAPWQVMDLSDPRRPRLTVPREALRRADQDE
jgi:hypothetical protein